MNEPTWLAPSTAQAREMSMPTQQGRWTPEMLAECINQLGEMATESPFNKAAHHTYSGPAGSLRRLSELPPTSTSPGRSLLPQQQSIRRANDNPHASQRFARYSPHQEREAAYGSTGEPQEHHQQDHQDTWWRLQKIREQIAQVQHKIEQSQEQIEHQMRHARHSPQAQLHELQQRHDQFVELLRGLREEHQQHEVRLRDEYSHYHQELEMAYHRRPEQPTHGVGIPPSERAPGGTERTPTRPRRRTMSAMTMVASSPHEPEAAHHMQSSDHAGPSVHRRTASYSASQQRQPTVPPTSSSTHTAPGLRINLWSPTQTEASLSPTRSSPGGSFYPESKEREQLSMHQGSKDDWGQPQRKRQSHVREAHPHPPASTESSTKVNKTTGPGRRAVIWAPINSGLPFTPAQILQLYSSQRREQQRQKDFVPQQHHLPQEHHTFQAQPLPRHQYEQHHQSSYERQQQPGHGAVQVPIDATRARQEHSSSRDQPYIAYPHGQHPSLSPPDRSGHNPHDPIDVDVAHESLRLPPVLYPPTIEPQPPHTDSVLDWQRFQSHRGAALREANANAMSGRVDKQLLEWSRAFSREH